MGNGFQSADKSTLNELSNRVRLLEKDNKQHLEKLHENERILKAINSVNKIVVLSMDLKEMLDRVLEEFLSIFSCDRAWMLYPCNPHAHSWHVPKERTRPEWPGALAEDVEVPMNDYARNVFMVALENHEAIKFDSRSLPFPDIEGVRKQFHIKSQLVMAVYPSVGEPWLVGIHHCEAPQRYSDTDCKLFENLVGRLGDGLSSLLLSQEAFEIKDKLNTELEKLVEERTKKLTLEIYQRKTIEESLKIAKAEAERANKAKSYFLSSVSHELRTPMNAIINLSHLALQGELGFQQRDFIEKVERSGNELLGLINHILDISKIEAGKLEVENIAFDMNTEMNNLIEILDIYAQEKGLKLIYQCSKNMRCHLIGDPHKLRQIMTNLINNAIKFTEEGEIIVSIKEKDKESDLVVVEFCIRDTGIGIKDEQKDKLFEPFNQADTSITRRFGGTGLGLAISKQIVELMGGCIRMESQYGEGSNFCLTLPFKVAEPELIKNNFRGKTSKILEERLSVINGAEILLVEDNRVNQLVASEILKRGGLNVTIANHGAEAVDMLKDKHFDLILMDLQMPVLNGYKATEEIRKTACLSELPIIAMTADAMNDIKDKCMSAGMNGYISKPIDINLLGNELLRWISHKQVR